MLTETVTSKVRIGFPRAHRIRQKSDFQRIQGGGRRLHSRHFVILLCESEDAVSRLGLVVSKRVDKRATRRNLLKRRLREVFRHNSRHFNKHFDIVIVARGGAAETPFEDVRNEILGALRKKGLLPE